MGRVIEKVAIVGASARAAAFSALRGGYEVVTADLFADADLAKVAAAARIENYPDGFVDWLAATECDAWIYTGALENYPELVGSMADRRPLCGNNERLRDARDPFFLQEHLRQAGASFPETRSDGAGLPLDGSWLCKTYRGSSGSGVWALDGVAARDRALRDHAVYQSRVNGIPVAAIYVVADGRFRILGLTRQFLSGDAEHPWQYVGSLGPLSYGTAIDIQLDQIGLTLVLLTQLRGVVGVDLVLDDGTAWVVEINPRYTASTELLERARGVSAIAAHVAACAPAHTRCSLDEALAPLDDRTSTDVFAKTIVFAPRARVVSAAFHDWALRQSSLQFADCLLADIPHAGEEIPKGGPVLTAFSSAPTAQECEQRLGERLAEVTARLYDG